MFRARNVAITTATYYLAAPYRYEDGFAILEKHGGWKLLEGCLKEKPSQRISAAAAASSGFCRV